MTDATEGTAAVDIAVRVDGQEHDEAVPVVLVHGITRSSVSWGWLTPRLAADRTVVRPDLRGHGVSDRAPGAYDLPGYVADVTSVLRDVVGRPAVVVGHSLGGLVVAAVAQARPELVAALLLVDPALALGEPWPDPDARPGGPLIDTFARQRAEVPEAVAAGDAVDRHAARVAARPSGHGDTVAERYADEVPVARAAAELACDLTVLDDVLAPPPEHLGAGWDPAAGIDPPTVVLAADRGAPDRVTRRRDAQRLAAAAPHARWHEVAGAGHELQDERAHRATFVAALDEVLDEADRRTHAG